MKIRIITPVVPRRRRSSSAGEYTERMRRLAGLCSETELDRVSIERGPPSIESRYDVAMAVPEVIQKIKEADVVDAIVINCFCDPGVGAGREISGIPILGPGQSSMLVAAAISNRFSILTVLKDVISSIEENARIYGLSEKIASIRAIDTPVLELRRDSERTLGALVKEGRKAIETDAAEALILGCTGMTGMADRLSEELGVHVVDPLPTALKLAETLAGLRLNQSKLTFPVPPEKTMIE